MSLILIKHSVTVLMCGGTMLRLLYLLVSNNDTWQPAIIKSAAFTGACSQRLFTQPLLDTLVTEALSDRIC